MSENILFLDFETTSNTDLAEAGLGRYLVDPTTRAYCVTFRLPGMASTDLWECASPAPRALVRHVEAGGTLVAHNAPFDFWIWNKILSRQVDVPLLRMEQIMCSAARARYNGLPGSLAGACEALGLPVQKDVEGGKYMKEIAANPDWTPETHPTHFARVFQYAVIDTDAMIGLWHATQPLPANMQARFLLDMRINDRGFGVDVEAARAMEDLKLYAESLLDYQVTLLTDGGVLAASEVAKIKKYAADQGQDMADADRESLKKILARDALPADVRELLELRLDASRAPKKSAAILRAEVDGRIQHSTVFHGALSGRSTARGAGGVQLLNVARPRPGRSAETCEAYLEAARRKDIAYLSSKDVGPILAALADAQRPLFCATKPGHILVGADESGIEARLGPWIANAESMLVEFEDEIDGYKVEASGIYKEAYEKITKDQRQIGKVVRLALQYGGGAGAFVSMAANYGVHLPDDQVDEIVWTYRATKPEYEKWWAMCEYSALIALDTPGREVAMPCGRGNCTQIIFVRDDRALRMRLPSGRTISYHNARLQVDPGSSVPIAVYDKPEGYVETLDRKILSNNQTQGLAADLFWEIMLSVDPVAPIVHHVYDEVILEVPRELAAGYLAALLDRMRIPPRWAPGLPLDAAGYVNDRWKKD